ncbi:MAG TPA: hypothetical protein VK523_02440, partial [Steroidobacteraceae bacterium]|nr:hypothetical protein [Steroidobacteraceae bacterium]
MDLERNTIAPAALGLWARIKRSWVRDRQLSLARRIRKGLKFIAQLIRARDELKDCNSVGTSARVAGRLRVENRGTIAIGDHLNVNSSWVPIELVTGSDGGIKIGDDVLINFGTIIAAASSVSIGSRSMIGPHCIISDVEIPESISGPGPIKALPIEIGKDVWLAGRVTIRPGVKIGDGAVVVAGSIVESDVPPHFMASGIPARLLPRLGAAPRPVSNVRTAPPVAAAVGASAPRLRGSLISDFRLDELVYELAASDGTPPVDSVLVPGEKLSQMLCTPSRADAHDFVVIWTRPESAVPAFARLLQGESVSDRDLNADVDAFCALIERSAANYSYVLLPTWTQPAFAHGRGLLDGRPGGALSALSAMNLRLMKAVEARANVYVLDAARWQAAVGPAAFNSRAWYLGQMAMARPLVAEAARDIRAALAALCGRQRKLLVFHRDTALWAGAHADPSAWTAPLETAYGEFHQALHILRRRGVLLALVGNSTESEMLEAIRTCPGAAQRDDDFAVCSAAEGEEIVKLTALTARLGVGLDDVVYIDARDAVRARL